MLGSLLSKMQSRCKWWLLPQVDFGKKSTAYIGMLKGKKIYTNELISVKPNQLVMQNVQTPFTQAFVFQ